ncbi:hypothetical protein [Sporosarcina luteola]|uniref:hypothetical protein n=1 Tax=Sporosarcina luteola TaxID=582850 RepID=UPI00203F9E44|nr:hypothetical protein [Sporosarcina luteola]MCM3711135.1 hypothetical protein [Sporosarcina luteola]
MVIIETVMKTGNGNKKERWIVIITLLALLSIFLLTHFLSIYPGGYSIEKQSGEVLIGKGADIKRVVLTNSELLNELKIASLESQIAHIKNLWYLGLLFTATCLIGIVNFKRLKLKKAAIITASLYVVLALLIILSYASSISSIEDSINHLFN